MNGIQKTLLFIFVAIFGFFGWVFLRPVDRPETMNYPVPQPTVIVTDPLASTAPTSVVGAPVTVPIATLVPYQPDTPMRPLGVYIPLEDACYQDDILGVGSTADTFWRVWFPRVAVVVSTGIVVGLLWLGKEMYEHTIVLNNRLALVQEDHDHELAMARIQATHPPERPIKLSTPTKHIPEVRESIPVHKNLVFYFAEMVSEVGLAVRDWERMSGYDRPTINTILQWMDEKAYLITPASPGKSAQWLNKDRIPTPETIVVRLGYEESEFAAWLQEHLEE